MHNRNGFILRASGVVFAALGFIFLMGTACPAPATPGTPAGPAMVRDPIPAVRPTNLPPNVGRRFRKTNLNYFIANFSPDLTQQRQVDITRAAFDRWQNATPLNFTRTFDRSQTDLIIHYGTARHCEVYTDSQLPCPPDAFEATTLGHGYFPNGPESGHCHMNDAFNYGDERLLASTLTHELGHNLGIDHVPDVNALMAAADNGTQTGELQPSDIQAVQRLYGSRDGTVQPDPPAQPPATDGNINRTVFPTFGDTDFDGLDDATEKYVLGTDPHQGDSDGDGAPDGVEAFAGLDPSDPDSDGDGAPDGSELDNAGNAFLPDAGFVEGDVSAFVGAYAGTDSVGAPLQFTVAADGNVTGTLSLTQYGFAEDYQLIGHIGADGRIVLVSFDYYFEYSGFIAGNAINEGTFTAEGGQSGTWTAAKTGNARLKTGDMTRQDIGLYELRKPK